MSERTRSKDTMVKTDAAGTMIAQLQAPLGTTSIAGYTATEAGVSHDWANALNNQYGWVGEASNMTDVIGSDRSEYNDCHHVKTEAFFPLEQYAFSGRAWSGYYNAWVTSEGSIQCSAGPSYILSTANSYWPSYWDSDGNAMARAAAKLEFGIAAADVNLPVMLGELRDFSRIYRGIGSTLKNKLVNGKSVGQSLTESLRRATPRSVGELVRAMIAADIANKFAVQPLIRDIRGLLSARERVIQSRRSIAAAKPVIHRARVSDSYTKAKFLVNSNLHETYLTAERTRVASAWAKVKYSEPSSLASDPPYMDYLDALEFDKPLSVAWELLPWSFAIDYLIQVGDWLGGIQRDLHVQDIPHQVIETGASVKRTATQWVTTNLMAGTATHPSWYKLSLDSGHPEARGYYRSIVYSRERGYNINRTPHPTISVPSLGQVGTLAELFALRQKFG